MAAKGLHKTLYGSGSEACCPRASELRNRDLAVFRSHHLCGYSRRWWKSLAPGLLETGLIYGLYEIGTELKVAILGE